MKYFAILLIIVGFSGCAVISKQYYYTPSVTHQTVKNHYEHSDYKVVYNKVRITNQAGDSVGSITTSNGFGHPLLMGPLIFPVFPVGGMFNKRTSRFLIDVDVRSPAAYFMPLAIDSTDYKRVRDSLNALKIGKVAPLNNSSCYMMVNGTKIPLRTEEFFLGNNKGHSYRLTADVKFRKVKTMRLVTGNALLDSTFKNVTFKRKGRLVFSLLGPGY